MSFLEKIKICIYSLILLNLIDLFVIKISKWLVGKKRITEYSEGIFCEKVLNELDEEQYLQHVIMYLKEQGYKDCIPEDEKTILCYDSVEAVEVLIVSRLDELEFLDFLGNIRMRGLNKIIIINKHKFSEEILKVFSSLEGSEIKVKLIEGNELVKTLRYVKEKNILLGDIK